MNGKPEKVVKTKDGTVRAGFIAQELQEAQKGSEYLNLVYESNPEKLEATYGKFNTSTGKSGTGIINKSHSP